MLVTSKSNIATVLAGFYRGTMSWCARIRHNAFQLLVQVGKRPQKKLERESIKRQQRVCDTILRDAKVLKSGLSMAKELWIKG